MSRRVGNLINTAFELCEELKLSFSVSFRNQSTLTFIFTKDELSVSHSFSIFEIEEIRNFEFIRKQLIATAYNLLNAWRA